MSALGNASACKICFLMLACGCAYRTHAYRTKRSDGTLVAARATTVGPRETVLDIGGTKVHTYFANGGRRFIQRPNFAKYLRCSGESMETCEECTGRHACMHTNSRDSMVLLNIDNSAWTRYIVIVEIHCSDQLNVRKRTSLQMRPVRFRRFAFTNGTRYTVDGNKLDRSAYIVHVNAQRVEMRSDVFKMLVSKIEQEIVELQIEYRLPLNQPLPIREAFDVKVRFIDDAFVDCEDNKVCLSTLGAPFATFPKQAIHLRSSNALQLLCLTDGLDPADAELVHSCEQWRACLQESSSEDNLKLLLSAGVPVHADDGDDSSHETTCSRDFVGCVDPTTTDVEGWACNCMDAWRSQCAAIGMTDSPNCFTAAYCLSDLVCPCWKLKACAEVVEIKENLTKHGLLEHSSKSLVERRAVENAEQLDSTLDTSIGSKGCI